jgi:hypothetical protein
MSCKITNNHINEAIKHKIMLFFALLKKYQTNDC